MMVDRILQAWSGGVDATYEEPLGFEEVDLFVSQFIHQWAEAGPPRYRVWNLVNFDATPRSPVVRVPVRSPIAGLTILAAMVEEQATRNEEDVTSNVFGFEVWLNSEWVEWEDGHGRTLCDLLDDALDKKDYSDD